MAGGIDWFRWHHGTVTDQKFPLIARRAQASVAEVIAVWACLLEAASMAAERGHVGDPDFEAMDCALGMKDGTAQRVHEAMQDREMVAEDGTLPAWQKRQPKREREEDPEAVAARQRAKRERDKADSSHVTPSHATSRQKTPRGEESREELIPPQPPKGEGRFPEFWAVWPQSDRKQDRKKCLEKWRRKGFDSQADAIVAHVEAMKVSRLWREGYDPAPMTYLNGERWLDGAAADAAQGQFAGAL